MEKIEIVSNQNARLIKVLSENLPQYKYSAFEKALRNKDVLINERRTKENVFVAIGDNITIFLDATSKKDIYSVFYQDNNIIVFYKDKGIEVCDGEFNIKQDYEEKQNIEIYPIHRIDRNTLGLVLFAKSLFTQKILIDCFKKGYVLKQYFAVVSNCQKEEDNLIGYLKKNSGKSEVKIFDTKVAGSVFVQTHYQKRKDINVELSLLDVKISEGKTHQIRAQLAHSKMPILGDEKYGDTKLNQKYKKHTQCLQAYKIQFNIPKGNALGYLNDIDLCAKLDKFLEVTK